MSMQEGNYLCASDGVSIYVLHLNSGYLLEKWYNYGKYILLCRFDVKIY